MSLNSELSCEVLFWGERIEKGLKGLRRQSILDGWRILVHGCICFGCGMKRNGSSNGGERETAPIIDEARKKLRNEIN